MLTDSGNSAVAVLHQLAKAGSWYYVPEQDSVVKVGFVKLAEKARHVFRIDLFNCASIAEVVSVLRENAQDPCFLGYPYGLVEADQRAHVSKQEGNLLKLQFLARFGESLRHHCAALDAHEVLNALH